MLLQLDPGCLEQRRSDTWRRDLVPACGEHRCPCAAPQLPRVVYLALGDVLGHVVDLARSVCDRGLTQLTLGVDRDSEIVAFDYDERDEGVKLMIRMAVEGCARNEIHSGLCGQAPSDYPDMAEYLVEVGIDSISLNPDTVTKTTQRILELENRLGIESRRLGARGRRNSASGSRPGRLFLEGPRHHMTSRYAKPPESPRWSGSQTSSTTDRTVSLTARTGVLNPAVARLVTSRSDPALRAPAPRLRTIR
jgi:PEP-utilising enzyme, PEP-binding domain